MLDQRFPWDIGRFKMKPAHLPSVGEGDEMCWIWAWSGASLLPKHRLKRQHGWARDAWWERGGMTNDTVYMIDYIMEDQ